MLEDDFVTVYGEVTGDYTYKTVQGGERTVHSDSHGYGVIWNEKLDLSAEEIYQNGYVNKIK